MIINNKKLFDNKCYKCFFCDGQECIHPSWSIPRHDSCIGFVFHSNLLKHGVSNKDISANSLWAELLDYGSSNQGVVDVHDFQYEDLAINIQMAILKQARLFYNILPLSMRHCSDCNFYFSVKCPSCSDVGDNFVLLIDDIKALIFSSLYQGGFLSHKPKDLIYKIQYLILEDINIMED